MEILVESCPSFEPVWAAHLAEWGNDVLYIAAGEFAAHLLAIHRSKDSAQLSCVAAAIERLLIEGAPSVKNLATAGILESAQNLWANSGENPEYFGSFLLPASRRAWEELNAAWSGGAK